MSRLRELLEEIHRRSLWQVLLVYVGTGYAILQAADLFIDRRDFPNWLFTGTLVLLLVGFPIVVLTAAGAAWTLIITGSTIGGQVRKDRIRRADPLGRCGAEPQPR